MAGSRPEEPEAVTEQPPEVLSGVEAIAQTEREICHNAVTGDAATAEGLALAGVRAASLSNGQAMSRAGGVSVAVSSEHKPNCNPGDNVVCSFSVEKGRPPIIVYTHFSNWLDSDNNLGIIGLQFTGLKATQKGQAYLEQILTLIKQFKKASGQQLTNHL